jgi:hypothetical protein
MPGLASRSGGLLDRLGSYIIGTSQARTLKAQKAALLSPACCTGLPGCRCVCPGRNIGDCCWYCTANASCSTYQCCDNTCDGEGCICLYLLCRCC